MGMQFYITAILCWIMSLLLEHVHPDAKFSISMWDWAGWFWLVFDLINTYTRRKRS